MDGWDSKETDTPPFQFQAPQFSPALALSAFTQISLFLQHLPSWSYISPPPRLTHPSSREHSLISSKLDVSLLSFRSNLCQMSELTTLHCDTQFICLPDCVSSFMQGLFLVHNCNPSSQHSVQPTRGTSQYWLISVNGGNEFYVCKTPTCKGVIADVLGVGVVCGIRRTNNQSSFPSGCHCLCQGVGQRLLVNCLYFLVSLPTMQPPFTPS